MDSFTRNEEQSAIGGRSMAIHFRAGQRVNPLPSSVLAGTENDLPGLAASAVACNDCEQPSAR
jgi:hypothetical protein